MGILKRVLGFEQKKQVSFTEITDENFQQEVLEESRPVMLFVWSDSCPHCKKMAPNVMAIGERYESVLKSVHSNSSLAPEALNALGVRGVPSLIFLQNKKVIERITGFRPETFLEELVKTHFQIEG